MKKVLTLTLVFLGLCHNVQTRQQAGVVPLEHYHLYNTGNSNLKINDGMYFKDINNHLDKFVGSWIGSYDDKTLTLEISILEEQFGVRISFDELLIKYKITNTNGNEVVNTIPFFDSYRFHMNGKFFGDTTTQYYANYSGLEWKCNQKGTAFIDYIDSSTLTFWILPDSDIIGPECPDGNIHILPTTKATEVTLTKQN